MEDLKNTQTATEENAANEPAENSASDNKHDELNDEQNALKYTDADVDRIVKDKLAKAKAKSDKAIEEAKNEAEKLAKMNAEQKQEYRLKQLEEENARLKSAEVKAGLAKEATAEFKENKIEATQEMLDLVVSDSAETTKANIEKLVNIIQTQLKLADAERAKGTTPKNYKTNGGLTKEDILNIKNTSERQRAIAENKELF